MSFRTKGIEFAFQLFLCAKNRAEMPIMIKINELYLKMGTVILENIRPVKGGNYVA